jgi:type II secretory ATPase GspE/PulE/Tfp pilus assembly ATPase PilB-like protein/DNA-binding response OmpR family regulator
MARFSSLFSDAPADPEEEGVEANSPAPYRILLVDDEPNVLSALRRVFHRENYEILTAVNGQDALELLESSACQLMISDYKMPGMDGAELLRAVKDKHPEVIRIMLTGHADTQAVMAAIKDGAVYKFILKPWNDDDLRVTVGLGLEQYDLKKRNTELGKENQEKSREIESLSKLAVTNRSQLAIMLHKRNLLNDNQVQEVYKIQQTSKKPTIVIITNQDWVSEKKIREILRKELMVEEILLDELRVDSAVASLIPRSFCDRQLVLPVRLENRRLTLAMADPMDMGLVDELRFTIGLEIQVVMANIEDIKNKINEVYGEEGDASFEDLETLVASDDPYEGIEIVLEDEDDTSIEDLLLGTNEPPAIRLVNAIILEAARLGASDIHIHPQTKNIVVRYRIDGVLADKIHIPNDMLMPLISRIKVMAELDITERRRPQDGRITVKTPMRVIDLRISTLPTINGEKIVMRMLDRNATVHDIADLGFGKKQREKILTVVEKPQGIILATGPTGSGKTTTLYSMLQHSASPEKNYVTIEDPVEYYLDMAGQVLIKEKIGLDFATVLRAILRQDPDVILLGEIRDFETAEVAFHAAMTGHLVYSTLHTNSAVATIARLLDLGLKPYVLSSALEAIIAQRLVRKICENCREPVTVPEEVLRKLGSTFTENPDVTYYHGAGCGECNQSGFKGRAGLYEVLVPSHEMCSLISSGAGVMEINRQAAEENNITLLDDAFDKVSNGITTVNEILRVLGPQVIL